jgi:uncharacterized protein YlxP (DUF503 family)
MNIYTVSNFGISARLSRELWVLRAWILDCLSLLALEAGPAGIEIVIIQKTGFHILNRRRRSIACIGVVRYIFPTMIVSMIQMIFEIPDIGNIKEKRRIIRSVKDKLQRRFNMSVAEVDLQDSLSFAQIGGALVSNSRSFGESVLQKAFEIIERDVPVRIQDMRICSEEF